jgi:TolA-binding protein
VGRQFRGGTASVIAGGLSGDRDKGINNTDAHGVMFAAVQGRYQTVQDEDARIAQLERQLQQLQDAITKLGAEVRSDR